MYVNYVDNVYLKNIYVIEFVLSHEVSVIYQYTYIYICVCVCVYDRCVS